MPVPQPRLIVFDVNETLSDMSPLQERFEQVGRDRHEAATWFAGLLRDGFALTVTGANPDFAELARGSLEVLLAESRSPGGHEDAVAHVLDGLTSLGLHDDVAEGITALAEQGRRLVTLSNGATSVAEALLEGAGLRDRFERLLTVQDAPAWKPGRAAYTFALDACGLDDRAAALLVAVHPWDIEGARRAGLTTAWINRSGAGYPRYFSRPDVEATSVLDLARQLG
ncbi:haloacid dehalogenase type II [Nocardioides sp. KIGAM211]|uniref:Haloacid dehalogenase type II n=1 Tax=Nocardioides luti TaxID=2761101 RepID=A0A7X0RIT1_9ACTN|nr:haloacid dehalogenase type II [Nocardioides luti]MBB6629124.1 haloacid dehalogenase type II [Nocardioides luti]